jgi:uncharacterized UPF0160 family protein
MERKILELTIAVHSGSFHADDVFAVAALKMYIKILSDDTRCGPYTARVIRTRDTEEIAAAGYRVDVGESYDRDTFSFDHHQPLDPRENGIPYASFGLIWKGFGCALCGRDSEVAKIVEKKLVYSIDMQDNGAKAIATREGVGQVEAFTISSLIGIHNPVWDEEEDPDEAFDDVVVLAEIIIRRMIRYAQSAVKAKTVLCDAIEKDINAPYIVLEQDLPWEEIIHEFAPKTLLYVIYRRKTGRWQIKCVEDDSVHRKSLPEEWAGLQGEDFAAKTGVKTATSCHKERFTAIAQTREDAIQLAELAISAK